MERALGFVMPRSIASAGTAWHIACLLLCGCGDDDAAPQSITSSQVDAGARTHADGSTDASTVSHPMTAPDPALAVVRASRHGSKVTIALKNAEHAYGWFQSYCSPPRLLKAAGGADPVPLQDDRPWRCGEGYYLDGDYVDNKALWICLGCDGGDSCLPLGSPQTLSTLEYVRVGLAPAPSTEDGGAEAMNEQLPLIESRNSTGPYVLRVEYRTDPWCQSEVSSVDLPVDVK